MWESCLSGSVRDRDTTMNRKKYWDTAAKAGGNSENKPHPTIMGVPYLLEGDLAMVACRREARHKRESLSG